MNTEWMVEAAVAGNNYRPDWMKKPFCADGWSCCTDGHFITFVKSESNFAPLDAEGVELTKYLYDITGEAIDLSRLRSWAKSINGFCSICKGKGTHKCDECNGVGEVHVECHNCDHTHWCECKECDSGFVKCKCQVNPEERGVLAGKVINKIILYRAIANIESDKATFAMTENGALGFDGDGWKVRLMPMNVDVKDVADVYEF